MPLEKADASLYERASAVVRGQVARRIQGGIPAACAFFLLAAGLDLQLRPPQLGLLLVIKGTQCALLGLEFVLLKQPWFRRRAVGLGLTVGAALYFLVGLTSILYGTSLPAMVFFPSFAMALAALLPWGFTAQLVTLGTMVPPLLWAIAVTEGGPTVWLGVGSLFSVAVLLPSLYVAADTARTHQLAVEQNLRWEESERRYRELVEHAVDLIYRTDATGIITYVNPEAEALFGEPRAKLVGRPYLNFVAPEWRAEVATFYERQFSERIPVTYLEVPIQTAEGTVVWLGQNVRLLTEGHRRVGFQAIARDVTDRKRYLEELRLSEERFRSAFERAPIGIALVAPSGRFLRVNPAFCAMLGYGPEELVATDFQSITHPDDLEADVELVRECLEGKRDQYEMEKRYLRRDGSIVYSRLLVGLVRDSRSRPAHFVSLIEDITERRRLGAELRHAKEAAEAAAAAKSSFLANMSHEIRTPLTGVLGMIDLLRDTTLDERQREYIELARNAGQGLLALLTDILDLSRIEAGKLEIRKQPFRLRPLLYEIHQLFALRAHEKRLTLTVEIDPRLPTTVRADPTRLRQILVNLVGNAIKFTPAGEVGVQASLLSEAVEDGKRVSVRFSVRDTGPGIAPEDLQRIFAPFEQANAQLTNAGAGLGLAIVSGLVQAMGGRIEAQSKVGSGSIFHVVLPLEVEEEVAAVETGADEDPRAPEAAVWDVLIAEDNPVNQLLLRRLLEGRGHQVRVVSEGQSVIEALAEQAADVLLLDVKLPDMDGVAVAEMIREAEAAGRRFSRTGRYLPIIAVTAHAFQEDRDRCLAARMEAFVTKPIQIEHLLRTIAEVLERSSRLAA